MGVCKSSTVQTKQIKNDTKITVSPKEDQTTKSKGDIETNSNEKNESIDFEKDIYEAEQKYHRISAKKRNKSISNSSDLKELESFLLKLKQKYETLPEGSKSKHASKIKEISNGVTLLKF